MTEHPLRICLRLDNGDTIRGRVGDSKRTAQLVRIKQQIDAGELSAEAQKRRLDDIAQIYQRLNERHQPQKCLIEGSNVRFELWRLCTALVLACALVRCIVSHHLPGMRACYM
jgi:hypothetical protein